MTLGIPSRARGIDTIETFAAGAFDFELYVGVGGLAGRGGGEEARPRAFAASELLVGYGLVDWFALCVGATLRGPDRTFREGDAAGYLLLVATPLDSDHVDLDLQLAVALAGAGLKELRYRPELELNFDLRPNLSAAGLYLRLGLPINGIRPTASGRDSDATTRVDLATLLGAYATFARRHQLLLEHDLTYHFDAGAGELVGEVGGVTLGYNLLLNARFELIHQLALDLDQRGRPSALGALVGLIVTI